MSTSPTTKLKTKPSYYSTFPFHAIRTISALSSVVVAGILIFFCIELKNEGYKIPWTFLIVSGLPSGFPSSLLIASKVLAASLFTLIWLLFTLLIHCCGRLSPIFNILLNIPLFLLWLVGAGLLAWGIYGTLSHSCTKVNWGNDDGIMICQEYKALFSFVVFGTLSQIALVVLDVRARITQTRSGTYAKMTDVKLEPYDSTHSHGSSVHDVPYSGNTNNSVYRDEPGWRPGQRTNTNGSNNNSNVDLTRSATLASSRYTDYGDIAGRDGQAQFRMGQFENYHQTQPHQTGYDHGYGNNGNAYGPRY